MRGLIDQRGGFEVQYFAGGVQYFVLLHILAQKGVNFVIIKGDGRGYSALPEV